MASLKAAFDQLEKLVRDKLNFVTGELTRAVVNITPEMHEELKKTFQHFDREKDGVLNKLQFSAAAKALDFEGGIDEAFAKFKDGETKNVESGETEPGLTF